MVKVTVSTLLMILHKNCRGAGHWVFSCICVCVLQYPWAVAVCTTLLPVKYLCPWAGFSWPESGGGGWILPTTGGKTFLAKNTFYYKGDVKGNYPFIYAHPGIDFKSANLATSQRCWKTYKKDELYISHDHIDPPTAADFWQVCFINVLRWNLRVVSVKSVKKRAGKCGESNSVQKSAKLVHLTFKVRDLQLQPLMTLAGYSTDYLFCDKCYLLS